MDGPPSGLVPTEPQPARVVIGVFSLDLHVCALGLPGLSAGLSTVLLLMITMIFIYLGAKDNSGLDHKRADDVFIMFRGMWLLIVLNWCWGIDMYTWTKYRVSYALIFLFDMRSHISWQQVQLLSPVPQLWVVGP